MVSMLSCPSHRGNHGDVDAGLEQGHGGAVPEDVRRYRFALQAGASGMSLLDNFSEAADVSQNA